MYSEIIAQLNTKRTENMVMATLPDVNNNAFYRKLVISIRYMVKDVEAAVPFYTDFLQFVQFF